METLEALKTVLTDLYDLPEELVSSTAQRLVRAATEAQRQEATSPEQLLSPLFEIPEGYDEVIVVRNARYESLCEHHLLPFFGSAHVAYIPRKHIVGLSKLSRLVRYFSRRPQLQERMTVEIARALWDVLEPVGVGVVLVGQHTCITTRGVHDQNAEFVTSKLYGYFKDDARARDEFLRLAGI